MNKLAVRLAAGADRLAQLVRRDQDLKAIVAAVSRESSMRDATAEQRRRDRQAVISAGRARLQKTFSSEFPDYAAGRAPIIF